MDDIYAQYVEAALQGAKYECARNGDVCGEIPGFYGLRSSGKTKAECEQQLRDSLEAWLKYRRDNELSIPEVGGFETGTSNLEGHEGRLDKLNRLERELQSLKIELSQEPARDKVLVGGIRRINEWYTSYWQLLVSLASLAILVIAYSFYGVDPIESYRETGDRIKMSERYVEIGDQLLLRSGSRSPEAVKAYQTALEVYPSNMNARHGLLKAQILDPETGRNEYDIEVARTKLSTARFYIGEDYYLSYVEGVIAMNQAVAAPGSEKSSFGDKAKQSFEKSRQLKPEFSGSHLGLGFHDLYFLRPQAALKIFVDAYDSGHASPAILTYLGSLNASYRKFDVALKYLGEANTLSSRLDTLIVLGDVFRNLSANAPPPGDAPFLRAAISRHTDALTMASRTNLVRGVDYDELLYTFMPSADGEPKDSDLIPLPFSTLDDFKVLTNYCLSFDYVLANDRKKADAAFETGFGLDSCVNGSQKQYKFWYENQVDYLIRERKGLSAENKVWLNNKKKRFASCQ